MTASRWITCALAAAFVFAAQCGTAGIEIVVNPGDFGSVEKAATSEEQVNFWDGDPSDEDACTESFAAVELRSFLAATGAIGKDIRIGWRSDLPESGYVFVLGSRRSNPLVGCLDGAGGNKNELTTPESYRVRVATHDTRTVCVIEGKGRVGTLYGVYDYLERIGMRFFGLGDKGTVYPPAPAGLITDDLDVVENPAFLTRGFHAWEDRGNEEFFLWMARNRMNYWTSADSRIPLLKKLGVKLAIGAHDIQTLYLNPNAEYPYNYPAFRDDKNKPADPYKPSPEYAGDQNNDGKLSYFEAHPEWFGLRSGKRSSNITGASGDNYCTSNDDATAELAKNYVQGLIDGQWSKADVVNFWMEDAGFWCECDDCAQLGTPTDRMLLQAYKVNREVQKARRDGRLKRSVHLTTLAYTETINPPTRPLPADFDYENCSVTFYPMLRCYVHRLDDPKCYGPVTAFKRSNKRYYEYYSGWMTDEGRYYNGAMFIGEYYNVSGNYSLPALYTRIMSLDIPMFYRTGARHFQYMHTMTKMWGTWALNQRLMARLLWDPNTDVDTVLDGYFARYYPTTAKHTRAFYGHLEKAFGNITVLKYGLARALNASGDYFDVDHMRYQKQPPVDNTGPSMVEMVEAIQLARQEIDQSLLDCSGPVEQLRLLEDERRFAYGEAMMYFYYHMTRTCMFDKRQQEALARNEFAYLERQAVALSQFGVDMIESLLRTGDGLAATDAVGRYTALKEKYASASDEVLSLLKIDSARRSNCLDWRITSIREGGGVRLAIFHHPAEEGDSNATYSVSLPKLSDSEKLILRFGTAISAPTANGVRFSIKVGSDELWSMVQERGGRSMATSYHGLDLTPWASQSIELTLTVNALGDPTNDWANWVDPKIVVESE